MYIKDAIEELAFIREQCEDQNQLDAIDAAMRSLTSWDKILYLAQGLCWEKKGLKGARERLYNKGVMDVVRIIKKILEVNEYGERLS